MKKFLVRILPTLLLCTGAAAQITTIRTLPGGDEASLQRRNGFSFSGVAGSSVSSAGLVTVRDEAITYGLKVGTVTATGYITGTSSVNASGFFGNGSALVGIPSTSSISGVYVPT